MNTSMRMRKLLPLAIGAGAMVMAAPAGLGQGQQELEFSELRLYFELNDTDGDLGIHGLIDGRAWKSLEIENPKEREILNIWVRDNLRQQGLTEIFFESAEPSFDELPPRKFFRRFPEGTYEVEGMTLNGREMEGEVELSHVMAAPPANITINGTPSAENCDATLPVVGEPITLDWDAVTGSHAEIGTPGEAVTVESYEVIGEIDQGDLTPDTLVFSVLLPAGVTSFEFPEDFTGLADGEMKFEIITKLDNGNQTAVESCIEIE